MRKLPIHSAKVTEDGLGVRLYISGLRETYVHELHLPGMRSSLGEELLHPVAYYTLNRIPRR